MAVTCSVTEAYGSNPTLVEPTSYLNFIAVDGPSGDAATAQASPITIPSSGYWYSFERWFYLQFAGNVNPISGIKVWKSGGTINSGFAINCNVKSVNPTLYVQAEGNSSVKSSFATTAIPSEEGSALVPSYNSTGSKSDYLVGQVEVASTAEPGPIVGTPAAPSSWVLSYKYNTTG